MLRAPVLSRSVRRNIQIRMKSSGFIRSSFIDYFVNEHGHKNIKSSSVVSLCDRTVPFVNAGMNQFKGIFLGLANAPYPRVVNSQKCVRVGGKHNDLDLVGTDGHHHTFFEMLGNWSFNDYYKKEACQMAWDLLLGPYRLKPENLLVTYFSGDAVIGLQEDKECRDIWKKIGVPQNRLKGHGARDNFWEMGPSGPCGPCTEIHYIHPDGSLTEIWNLVFIQCNREVDGSVTALRQHHVDTGLGLERLASLLQGVPSNYDTDLFKPLIKTIEKSAKVPAYKGRFGQGAELDTSYRRLADHARLLAICLADGALPSTNLNVKQIMRKSFKLSTDVFKNPNLVNILYDEVVSTLGDTYPELIAKEKEAKLIIEQEKENYSKLRADLAKKWKNLAKKYPEVEALSDIEISGFALGYEEFKETMTKINSKVIPGDLVFKMYDTHGFQEDVIERIAKLNNMEIDKKQFWKLLTNHKMRHKTAFKEQTSKNGIKFDKAVEKLAKSGIKYTNDLPKYDFIYTDNKVTFRPLKTKIVGILNEDGEWLDFSEPCENRPYYIVTESTNFYCEEGGQAADDGVVQIRENIAFNVDSVFKIRGIIFHKGEFSLKNAENMYVSIGLDVSMIINREKRLSIMRNHTGVHLLNAAVRQVLPDSVICQTGSSVTDRGLSLSLSIYGEKLSAKAVEDAQALISSSISSNVPILTRTLSSTELPGEGDVLTVPGEVYPEFGLRLVSCTQPLASKELCCGTHVPSTGQLQSLLVTSVRAIGSRSPTIYALTGTAAMQARELFCRVQKLAEVIDLAEPLIVEEEVTTIRDELKTLCGSSGAPAGDYHACLTLMEHLKKNAANRNDTALLDIARTEIDEACSEAQRSGRRFTVHFLRCSYLMRSDAVRSVLAGPHNTWGPAMLIGCAGGVVIATAKVPQELVTSSFTADKWLSCILPIFEATILPPTEQFSTLTHAEMSATKVSLINCEQMVQDAMRVAIKYAQAHLKDDERKTDVRHN
ncbi:unnamed protein product [Danaus chrysippus]|uniref:Alanine--tRNA ligase n=1 Tax=Danaus chrysippus TaxID=151541 RepID=A0A8J2QMP6_9NEOP|nr:unnamed protein product [Danaus chrysippus]